MSRLMAEEEEEVAPEPGGEPEATPLEEGGEAGAPEPPRSRVRVILRIRPLLRREYGYKLAADKLEGNRRARLRCSGAAFDLPSPRACPPPPLRLRLSNGKTEVLTAADVVLDETATQEEARRAALD